MRALIVHESFFGNTRQVAEAMATALDRGGHDVRMLHAADVTPEDIEAAELLLLGAPTHVHGMPRESSRRGAVQQGAAPDVATARGMREVLDMLGDGRGRAAAAFDTRARMPRWMSGAASRPIAARLRQHGYRVVVPAQSFLVEGTRGPLRAGEVERAQAWAGGIASRVSAPLGVPLAR